MLSLFTGTPGSGKSYHATERIDRCLKQGINVICTYPIKTNYKHRGLFVYVPYYELTPEFLINFCMEHHDLKCNPEKCQTFLMSMSGVGLSEKIETLVHSYVDELPKLEKKIAERKRYLSSVDDEILKKEKLLVNLNHIERYIRSAVPFCNSK